MRPRRSGLALLALAAAYALAAGCGDVTGDLIVRDPNAALAGCTLDAACGAEAPRCELESGTCVECLEAADCLEGELCALPANVCVPSCQSGGSCSDLTPVCDLETGLCRACAADADCSGSTPLCQASGACVACRASSDCAGNDDGGEDDDGEDDDEDEEDDASFCDAAGRCVECLNDGHCDDVAESCSTFLGECAEPCSAAQACGADDPICDDAIGFCVECRTDADCEADELCRGSECVD